MSATISLEGLKFHAFHGIYPQEKLVGSIFMVDIHLTMKLPPNGFQDDLNNTIDYERVYASIAEIMKTPKHLIETLAENIIEVIFSTQPLVEVSHVLISKMHPPVGGECLKSKIELKKARLY